MVNQCLANAWTRGLVTDNKTIHKADILLICDEKTLRLPDISIDLRSIYEQRHKVIFSDRLSFKLRKYLSEFTLFFPFFGVNLIQNSVRELKKGVTDS